MPKCFGLSNPGVERPESASLFSLRPQQRYGTAGPGADILHVRLEEHHIIPAMDLNLSAK